MHPSELKNAHYVKLWSTIYDGSLRRNVDGMRTFIHLLILADADGLVFLDPHAIAGRTGEDVAVIERGIKVLLEPDPFSRTPTEDGRRIVPIDNRGWGWRIVNFPKYRGLQKRDDRREYLRLKKQEERDRKRQSTTSQHCQPQVVGSEVEGRKVEAAATQQQPAAWPPDFPAVLSNDCEIILQQARNPDELRGEIGMLWQGRGQPHREALGPAIRDLIEKGGPVTVRRLRAFVDTVVRRPGKASIPAKKDGFTQLLEQCDREAAANARK